MNTPSSRTYHIITGLDNLLHLFKEWNKLTVFISQLSPSFSSSYNGGHHLMTDKLQPNYINWKMKFANTTNTDGNLLSTSQDRAHVTFHLRFKWHQMGAVIGRAAYHRVTKLRQSSHILLEFLTSLRPFSPSNSNILIRYFFVRYRCDCMPSFLSLHIIQTTVFFT